MAEEMPVGCARPTGGPVGRSVQETLRQLQAFQLIRETKRTKVAAPGARQRD
jgi:alkyl hydroperoxide reductase subunit AhpC